MDESKITQQVQVAVPQVTQQDFINLNAQKLGSYRWPKGAIESIDPRKLRLVYLWGNRYKGKAEGAWSAKVDGSPKITVNNQEVNIKDGTPYSGSFPEADFDILVINDNQATPEWARKFCKIGFESDNFQPQSYVSASGGVIEGDNSGNPHSAWMKYGNEIVDNYLLPLANDMSKNTAVAYVALDIIPLEVIQQSMSIFNRQDFNSRDVAVTSRNSVTEDPIPVLIPFYVLEYQFEGQTYYMAMMADKKGLVNCKVPGERGTGKSPEQIVEEEMPDKIKQVKIMKWGWTLAIVALLVVNFTVAVVCLIAWAAGYWFMKKQINDRIKEILDQDTIESKKTADLLRKQLTK
ncbi:MAG: hypothetical protein IKH01_00435 [Prevotella sp.]|nr:hypothetical protein [Prevotella sp.]